MISYTSFKKQALKDPELKRYYDELQPEYELMCRIIERRAKEKLTQKQLAERMGTKQSAISRFESGKYNPTLDFLYRLADALGAKLKVTIE